MAEPDHQLQRRGMPVLLWGLVLVQLILPSSYYLWRDDADDERFAWRMFSAIRLRQCTVEAVESDAAVRRDIDLPTVLHASWIGSLRRGRRNVIAAFLRTRCEQQGMTSVELTRRCRDVGERPGPSFRYSYDCVGRTFQVVEP